MAIRYSELVEHPEIELDLSQTPKTDAVVKLHTKVEALNTEFIGPYIRNQSGEIVTIQDSSAWISKDEGLSWQAHPLFKEDQWSVYDNHALCITQNGTIIASFPNMVGYHFKWLEAKNRPSDDTYLSIWVVRSLDGGKTWQVPTLVQKGYGAATSTLIQLKTGELVMSAQALDYEQARHFSLSYVSKDDGLSWHASNKLDIGGRGHHAGCYEGTLIELNDGRVWYLIRTNRDWFWHAYSNDQGRTWQSVMPGMEASSSPGMLTRLNSGRIMLVFNTLYPEGASEFKRTSGQFSEIEASWFREELAVIFSEDEGITWTKPTVLAQCKNSWLAYAYVFEQADGVIWITTMQSQLKIKFREADLL
ncbi:MAG: sialidase-1 [Thiomicrorhabdus sp.]|nr:MAG: sialidase-1 [Thiomicrorhabdus sp.]